MPQKSPPSVKPSQVVLEEMFIVRFLICFSLEELTPEPIIIVPFFDFLNSNWAMLTFLLL